MGPKRKHATCDSKYLATAWRKSFSPHWAEVCDVSYEEFFFSSCDLQNNPKYEK